jgi:lipoate-protein ligase A
MIGRRKVVGLCQARRRTGALLQAGILLRLDAAGLAGLLDLDGDRGAFADALRARAVGLDETLARLDVHDVVAALDAAVVEGLEGTVTVAAYDHSPGGRAESI